MSLYKRRYSLAPATNNISEKSVLSGYLKYTEQQKNLQRLLFLSISERVWY